ncbi:MAG: ABC transporter substrate-binding protein [Nitrospirae bacterium]|nr:ABC transporter substrate-binding protein [Candidatus Manganitrophaceae bacterium]
MKEGHGRPCPSFYWVLSLFLCLPFAAACTPPPPAETPFTVAIESAPTQFDPRLATDAYSERIGQLLFSRLIRSDPTGQKVGDLAERWEREGETVYTFHLKRNVRFHDGHPLTAEDVRYTFESILDPRIASPHRKNYEVIARIETPDDTTVRFILKQPHAPFLTELTRGIVPKHLAEKEAGAFAAQPVGSGPFRFVRYDPDDAVELAAYPDYFGGPPAVRRLLFRIIPEDSVRLLELEKGNIDLLQNAFPPDALTRLQQNPRLKIISAPSTTYTYLGFNLKDPILRNRSVREAIALAINRDDITEHLFKGLAHPAAGLLSPSHWAYADAVAHYSYNPDLAKKRLDEAGYPDPPGPANRFKLIHKTSQNELSRRVVEVIQRQLADVGIEVEIRNHEWGTFYGDIKSGNFQLFTLSWVGVDDPDLYYNLFHSESTPPNGANRVAYKNPRLDRLVESGRTTLDPEKRKKIYEAVQQIVAEDLPYVSLWHTDNIVVMKKEVEGYILYPDGDFYSLTEVRRKR